MARTAGLSKTKKRQSTTCGPLLFVGVLVGLLLFVWWLQLTLRRILEDYSLDQPYPLFSEYRGLTRLKYTGSFGLGHRLSKLTAAYYLAVTSLHVSFLEVDWGFCGEGNDGDDIFTHLFGTNEIVLPALSAVPPRQLTDKVVWVRNDVHGYYAGQAYKNFEIPLTPNTLTIWQDKLRSDTTFLGDLFNHKLTCRDKVQHFQNIHRWKDHMVIGIHIRAGNGEQEHFADAERDKHMSQNVTTSARTIHILLKKLLPFLQQQHSKPPLVFLATDTASYIPLLRHSLAPLSISVVVWEQPRVLDGKGVSYQAWQQQKQQCLQGWMDAATDMALLASVDILVAATRSTFSQIAPAAIVFQRNNQQQSLAFCEMDLPLQRMTCFRDQLSWLLRQKQRHGMVTFAVDENGGGASVTEAVDEEDAVSHKVMVHLPDADIVNQKNDPILSAALEFLRDDKVVPLNETIFYYGRKYNRKYRERRPFRKNWMRQIA